MLEKTVMDRDNTIAMSDSKRASAFAHYSPFALLPDKTILTRYLNPKSRFALSQTLQSLFEEEDRADSLLPELNSMNPIISLGSPLEPLLSSKDMFDKSMIENKGSILASGAPFSLASALNVSPGPIKLNEKHTKYPIEVIGHRGSLYTALENTSLSFLHAFQAGADGVELDVFLLKCGTLVVFHGSGGDEKPGLLDQYCAVEGSILDYTASEAKRLLTFNKHYEEFGCGPEQITHPHKDPNSHYCYVHSLEEVLTTLRDHPEIPSNFSIKIELKGPGTALPAVRLVQELDMKHRCHYSSFDHSRIAEVRALDTSAITGALFADNVPDDFVERSIAVGASQIHLKYDSCTYERIRRIHHAGLQSMAWFRGPIGMKEDVTSKYFDVGNEDESMYEVLIKSGVQSICGNRPDVIVKVVEKQGRRLKWTSTMIFEDEEEKKADDLFSFR